MASGGPSPDGTVLWTRLARDPVHPDGLGGMPGGADSTLEVEWEVAADQRFDDPASPGVGTELVSSSITSGEDGSETRNETAGILAQNPHVKFFNNRRGYVRTRITPETITADFRMVPYVPRPDAPAETRASFVIEDRGAGLNQV